MYNSIIRLLYYILFFISTNVFAQDFQPLEVKNPQTGRTFVFNEVAITNLWLLNSILQEYKLEHLTETLQAMMMVETQAGIGGSIGLPHGPPSIRSYGLMQVTIPTARTILQRYDDLRYRFFGDRNIKTIKDKEIKILLLQNAEANIHIGVRVFVEYLSIVKNEWARAVAAYNMGIGNALKRRNAIKSKYVNDVKKWMPIVSMVNATLIRATTRIETNTEFEISQPVVDITSFKEDTVVIENLQKENNDEETDFWTEFEYFKRS